MCLKVELCVFLAFWCAIAFAIAQPIVLDYEEDYTTEPYDTGSDYITDADNGQYAIVDVSGMGGNPGYQQQEIYCQGSLASQPCPPSIGPAPTHPTQLTPGHHPTHRPHPTQPPHHSHHPYPGYPYPVYPYPYPYPSYPYPIYREPPVRRPEFKRLCVKIPSVGLLCGPSVRFD